MSNTAITIEQAEAVEALARRLMGEGRTYRPAHGEVFQQAIALWDKLNGVEIEASDDALYDAIEETCCQPEYYAAIRNAPRAMQVAA